MRIPRSVTWLASIVVLLGIVATCVGLFWGGGPGSSVYTSLRGEEVEIYGRGIYAHDSIFRAAGNRGTDVATLALGVPLLIISTVLARRGSARANLFLLGLLAYFLYVYASVALSSAYNGLFLVYVALFAASLFAFVQCFSSLHRRDGGLFPGPLPRRGIAAFMFFSGVATVIIWLMPLIDALARGVPPDTLQHYTTMVTEVLDLGVIVPAVFISGFYLVRRRPLGYLVAIPLLVLIAMLLPAIALQTAFQVSAGVSLTPGEIIGPIAGFAILGALALWILAVIARKVPKVPRDVEWMPRDRGDASAGD
ncbi:MAG TPA: hypothetical protein VIL51_07315 [Thermoleophilia bacterium]|jgi:hypothetical protein